MSGKTYPKFCSKSLGHPCLFRSRFRPKKAPPRKCTSVLDVQRDCDFIHKPLPCCSTSPEVKVKLGNHNIKFQNGKWKSACDSSPCCSADIKAELNKLRCRNKKLFQENNFLKLRQEILFDMLVETTAEVQLLERKIAELIPNKGHKCNSDKELETD